MVFYFCAEFLKERKEMKNIGFILVLLGLVVSCQKPEKVGFIDNGEIINKYQEKLDIEEKYKVKDEAFTKRTDSIGRAFQLEAQDFQVKSQSMSAANAQKKYEELGQKQQVLQQQLQFEQQQLQQAFSTEIDSVIVKVKEFVEKYGKENGYTFIFGTSDVSRAVMYGKEEKDLTKIILDALNAEYDKK